MASDFNWYLFAVSALIIVLGYSVLVDNYLNPIPARHFLDCVENATKTNEYNQAHGINVTVVC